MRRVINKLLKREKKEQSSLDAKVLRSVEFQALQNMNYVMNFFDNIEKIDKEKFDPMYGDELYINARFAANNFLNSLIEKISKEVTQLETDVKVQSEQETRALAPSQD